MTQNDTGKITPPELPIANTEKPEAELPQPKEIQEVTGGTQESVLKTLENAGSTQSPKSAENQPMTNESPQGEDKDTKENQPKSQPDSSAPANSQNPSTQQVEVSNPPQQKPSGVLEKLRGGLKLFGGLPFKKPKKEE